MGITMFPPPSGKAQGDTVAVHEIENKEVDLAETAKVTHNVRFIGRRLLCVESRRPDRVEVPRIGGNPLSGRDKEDAQLGLIGHPGRREYTVEWTVWFSLIET